MADALFDLSAEYDRMLARGLSLTGEDKAFFIEGRLRDLAAHIPAGFVPRRILDFGCGTGDTTRALRRRFPSADIVGVDTARNALDYAQRASTPADQLRFAVLDELGSVARFDLCYVNGVFHHIEPERRFDAARLLHRSLNAGGRLAFFENNPWNPATRLVMARIPFDAEATPLSAPGARRLLRSAGFEVEATRFLFYFPRPLAWLRCAEPWLTGLPMGGQYHVVARRR